MGRKMRIVIDLLKEDEGVEYDELLGESELALVYASFKYQRFLKRVLRNSEPIYLGAREGGHLVAALPAFVCYNRQYGNVLNSLPFYGSNGGVIVSSRVHDEFEAKQALIRAFHELAQEKKAIVSTLITNPLDEKAAFYEAQFCHTLRDERIGQVTSLPTGWRSQDELEIKLMDSFHSKTRNCIRKGQGSDLTIYHSDSMENLEKLASLHQQNLVAIGGMAKPWMVFAALRETFTYDQDYRVYMAEKDGEVIAALLVFFYNRTAEYFTPATAEGYRRYQPMSLLVYEAMQEATQRGLRFWNWGGTWLTQGGVYHFKSRWGTSEHRYFYYIREYGRPNLLRTLSPEEITKGYPYFYVMPFHVLERSKDRA
jgi:hypothetical protein